MSNIAFREPADELGRKLLALWKNILRTPNPGMDDNFFDAGGDSLLGAELLTRIFNEFGIQISLDLLYRYPSVSGIASIIRDKKKRTIDEPLFVMRTGNPGKILFMFSGAGSDVVLLRDLAGSFTDDCTIIGCQYPGLDGKNNFLHTVPEMASFFLKHMRTLQPAGPYCLAGISFGGMVAFETARQLEQEGEKTAFLGLLDTYAPGYNSFKRNLPLPLKLKAFQFWCLPVGKKQSWSILNAYIGLGQKILVFLERLRWTVLRRPSPYARRFRGLRAACLNAWSRYTIEPVIAPVTVFHAEQQLPRELFCQERSLGWKKSSKTRVDVITVPGRHHTLMHPPHVSTLAQLISDELLKIR